MARVWGKGGERERGIQIVLGKRERLKEGGKELVKVI